MKGTKSALPEVLTTEEAAAYLRVASATIYRLAAAGGIPVTRIGRSWRFSMQLLDEWLSERM
jgi:excisionase family DNA binding protein